MGEVHMTLSPGTVAGVARVTLPGGEGADAIFLVRSHGMDGIRELLSAIRDAGLTTGNFRGLLHILIGRKITRPDGSSVSNGLTWRILATELKSLRFDTELVREFGADPATLAARDRERFWYSAIAVSKVDSQEASAEADKLIPKLKALGFVVGPAPASIPSPPAPPKPKAETKAKEKEKDDKPAKKKKK
jgi:hypothetical protein